VTSISRSSVLPPEYLQALSNEHVQAVIVLVDGMFFQERKRIAQLAASARLPAVYGFREHVDAGGLISYGVNLADNFRRAATYVVKILKGAKPGDLAVEFPNKLELIINLKASKALGGRPFADTCQHPLCAKSGPSLTIIIYVRNIFGLATKEASHPSMMETSRATTSAVPPTADIVGHRGHVRKVPVSDSRTATRSALYVRAGLKRWRRAPPSPSRPENLQYILGEILC